MQFCNSRRQVFIGNSPAFGRPGKKIERQSVAAAIDEILATRRRWHRHLDAVVAVDVMKSRRGGGLHRHAVGKACRDRNTRCRAGLHIALAA
jgi:hypothetical protein